MSNELTRRGAMRASVGLAVGAGLAGCSRPPKSGYLVDEGFESDVKR